MDDFFDNLRFATKKMLMCLNCERKIEKNSLYF